MWIHPYIDMYKYTIPWIFSAFNKGDTGSLDLVTSRLLLGHILKG